MIQFILMLLGLALPSNNVNIATSNNSPIITSQSSFTEDTGGETGQTPPPPKKSY